MKIVRTAGGIVACNGRILLIQKGDRLAIPKGHIELGETTEAAAIREVEEETGYRVAATERIGTLSRQSTEYSGEVVNKEITVFLMRLLAPTRNASDEQCEWVPLHEAPERMWFTEERKFLLTHMSHLNRQ